MTAIPSQLQQQGQHIQTTQKGDIMAKAMQKKQKEANDDDKNGDDDDDSTDDE